MSLTVAAVIALRFRRRAALGFAGALAAAMTLACLPFYSVTITGLNSVMAPRAAGSLMAEYVAAGYRLIEYDPSYLGHFHYHACRWFGGMKERDGIVAAVRQSSCGLVAAQDARTTELAARIGGLETLMAFRQDSRSYGLARWVGPGCRIPSASGGTP